MSFRRLPRPSQVRELDATVGQLMAALEALRLANSTLVLFTGDNGGGDFQCEYGGDNAPYLGLWQRAHGGGSTGKTSTWEGGHREPGLAVWPGQIPAGATFPVDGSTVWFARDAWVMVCLVSLCHVLPVTPVHGKRSCLAAVNTNPYQ